MDGSSPGGPRGDPLGHVAVVAALGRLARQGGWERLRAGEALVGLDHVDAELLAGAGLVGRITEDRFSVSSSDLSRVDASALEHQVVARLRRALDHLDRTAAGWTEVAPELIQSQGRGSGVVADILASEMLPRMPGSRVAIESGSARFLDVGVGIGAISAGLCRRYAGLSCVGIDVHGTALALAAEELTLLGVKQRVELRRQSVVDLPDEAAFDLAWLPQPFIPRTDLEEGLAAVLRALRADRWIVVPIADPAHDDPLEVAVSVHGAEMLGGGPLAAGPAEMLLTAAGFVDVLQVPWTAQTFLLGRRP